MTPEEIRTRLLDVVQENGGHLASSLGAVEIACALSEIFNPETDRVVWDVGHQAYAWKLLTGRADRFATLRRLNGISGFPNPAESRADAAVAGHAGAALSVAAGFAAARDRSNSTHHVVAVIGDAAIANGTSFEALNNLEAATRKVIVVLNDNEMSISRPVGSLAKLFGRLITNVRYNRVKAAAEKAGHHLRLTFLRRFYHRLESRIKSLFLGNAYFEQFGLRYIGPVDGHALKDLRAAFQVARDDKRSVLVHVVTKKGKGFEPAEKDPTRYHGIAPRVSETKEATASAPSWTSCFGSAILSAARENPSVVTLTAGMKDGTGLKAFAQEFPSRFFDVGISEGHLVAFAAGLAAGGMRPVVAVYSTFLQRAVDQVMHDVCIAGLPVVFCVDRAGVVGADGVTHQGVFDLAMLKALPNLTIVQPADERELGDLLAEALRRSGPTVIRYPRGRVPKTLPELSPGLSVQLTRPEANVQLWATGDQVAKALSVADRLGAGVVYARSLKPFDRVRLDRQRRAGQRIVSLENGSVIGGFGESIGADARFGWPDVFVPHGSVAELERQYGFDAESIVRALSEQGDFESDHAAIPPREGDRLVGFTESTV